MFEKKRQRHAGEKYWRGRHAGGKYWRGRHAGGKYWRGMHAYLGKGSTQENKNWGGELGTQEKNIWGRGHKRKKILESEARIFGERRHAGRITLGKKCTQEDNVVEGSTTSTPIWERRRRRKKI
jgi:hypothetical protein